MADPAAVAGRQEARPQGVIANLVTLPFRLFGALLGSLLLSVLTEWLGMHFGWPRESWHHAQSMLRYELTQLSRSFTQSLLLSHPATTARYLVDSVSPALFSNAHLAAWARTTSAHPAIAMPHMEVIRHAVSVAESHIKPYALAAGYTLLTFLVRLLILTLTLPLFLLAAFVGLIDGLVRRDLRRFHAAHESGFLYHRARSAILPTAVLPWVVYLALPVSVSPLLILLPAAILLGLAINVTAAQFKKYL